MRLGQLLNGMAMQGFSGDPELELRGIVYDSRAVKPGYLFVALRGRSQDGHAYVKDAVERGAVGVVVERQPSVSGSVAVLRVPDSREALSKLALRFHNPPLKAMNLVGITGTNGKTTVSFLLESVMAQAGLRPGVIGTVNYRYPGHCCAAPVTTPESLDLMAVLRKMADAGTLDVVMEVSSHALEQGRTRHCPFRVAVFTNLSRDHLDYHGSMEAYFQAKSRLFRDLDTRGGGPLSKAVINMDDPKGPALAQITPVPVVSYGVNPASRVRAEHIGVDRNGIRADLVFPDKRVAVFSRLLGRFNVYNILAAASAAWAMGIPGDAMAGGIEALESVPGRLERVKNRRGLHVIVDYAHTPDALSKALETLRALTQERLICVFGCGGDRDRGKRREMGRVAGRLSDLVWVTTDNPRTEDPGAIARAIEAGIQEAGVEKLGRSAGLRWVRRGYRVELDRRRAIQAAVGAACKDDVVLIAGKGHEDYQIVGQTRRPFDDCAVAADAMEAL